MVWTLPNILTVARIALTPVIALLPFINGWVPKLLAFIIFLAAAISDIYDGRIARERNEVTDLGKILDPIADKLLLFATLVPIYIITTTRWREFGIPWWRSLPLWVAAVLVGREVVMTVFRYVARRRGILIPAAGTGKLKTIFQDIFIGAAIGWFAWRAMAAKWGWQRGWFGRLWNDLHGHVVSIALGIALLLTVYSLVVYLYRYRRVLDPNTPPTPQDGH